MSSNGGAHETGLQRPRLTTWEWMRTGFFAGTAFVVLGTVTALWDNPFFIRMTPVTGVDYVILALESLSLGLYLGVRTASCAVGRAGVGGVMSFLGFGCSICNKILMLIFGGTLLLNHFEPYRYYVGFFGIALLGVAVYRKLERRFVFPTI